MPRLSRSLLRQGLPHREMTTGGRLEPAGSELPETILQFGEGAFLRGFVDWMVDIANEQGQMRAGIVVVPPCRDERAEPFDAQDGLYTLLLRGMRDGKEVEERRIVTSIRRAIRPDSQWHDLVACFRGPALRFVVSNTTEAGIRYVDETYQPEKCPVSFPAKVTSLLYERFQATSGDAARGLIFLPCELIDANGDQLLTAVLRHAAAWGLPPAFATWLHDGNYFLNTLVDRIVTGYPQDEAERLGAELGYEDLLLNAGETFHLWVIQGPEHLKAELPFQRAGLNVVWSDDLHSYRTQKIRILNGAHTIGAMTALPAGIRTVGEMMADPLFEDFLRRAVFDEILPTVPRGDAARCEYAGAVFQRFRNPHLRHELLSISLAGLSKWKNRILPSLLDSLHATGRMPARLAFSLAALACFYRGERSDGTRYAVRDEPAVLAFFEDAWTDHRSGGRLDRLAARLLAMHDFWGFDLNEVGGLPAAVTAGIEAILARGMRRAVEALDPTKAT
jgi:tagaturonate reductase